MICNFFEFLLSVDQQSSFTENCWLLTGGSNIKCDILILEIRKKKMPNQVSYIPSGSIGEIEYNIEEKPWYAIQSTEFNKNKVIPF